MVLADVQARGKTSGLPVRTRVAHVLMVTNGNITRWESYADPAEGLKAVGLSE